MSRTFILSLGVAVALQLCTLSAAAEPNDAAASAAAKEAMDGDYLATRFKDAEKKLQKALKACGKQKCSAKLRAALHVDLATVYIAGLSKKDKGKKEMRAAVQTDPAVQLNPDFSTPEVEKIFKAAGGKQAEPKPAAVDLEEDENEEKPAAAPLEAEAEASSDGSHKNWVSLSFQQDFLSYRATTGVCSSAERGGAEQYQCFLQGKSFGDTIYGGAGNELRGGVGLATRRVLLGYERLFGENITLGGRLGFAFSGSPTATTPDAQGFLPVHVELRGSYWFGDKPFTSTGLRAYAGLAAGVGEVDGHVTVEYFVDQAGYQANRKGKLDAWRKTGTAFLGLHAGLSYAVAPEHALFVELRVLQMLPASALGGALNLGYALGL